jgi:hypothetical protein
MVTPQEKINPVVLICTHDRPEITSTNIEGLLKQAFKPKVVLVATSPIEAQFYRQKFPDIFVVTHGNSPLGAKWQYGVNQARLLMPNPLIITGSDDLLSPDYIKNAILLMQQGYHFAGLSWFYMYEVKEKRLSTMRYKKPDWPIGGGRFYSFTLLEKLGWQLFDGMGKKNLDNKGFINVKNSGAKYVVFWEPKESPFYVLAVKGVWKVMNEAQRFYNSPYIDVLSKEDMAEEKFKTLCVG